MFIYKTRSGQTFDHIAFEIWGSSTFLPQLLRANLNLLTTVIFSAGTPVIIPDIDNPVDPDFLPPWR